MHTMIEGFHFLCLLDLKCALRGDDRSFVKSTSGGLLNCAPSPEKKQQLLTDITGFVKCTKGLQAIPLSDGRLRIQQSIDGKFIIVDTEALDDVLVRSDVAGEEFIQVNFTSGKKVLLTDTLIGFKPAEAKGLDAGRIPRVVTTPDVVNVFEAIQDALHSSGVDTHEMSILKKVFEAVLTGGESVGFDLSTERSWLARIPSSHTNISS